MWIPCVEAMSIPGFSRFGVGSSIPRRPQSYDVAIGEEIYSLYELQGLSPDSCSAISGCIPWRADLDCPEYQIFHTA